MKRQHVIYNSNVRQIDNFNINDGSHVQYTVQNKQVPKRREKRQFSLCKLIIRKTPFSGRSYVNHVCTASGWSLYGSIIYMNSGYTVTGDICRDALLLSRLKSHERLMTHRSCRNTLTLTHQSRGNTLALTHQSCTDTPTLMHQIRSNRYTSTHLLITRCHLFFDAPGSVTTHRYFGTLLQQPTCSVLYCYVDVSARETMLNQHTITE